MMELTHRMTHGALSFLALALSAALLLTAGPVHAQEGGPDIITLTLVPNRLDQTDEIRINTGKKATLSDGSFNTVYELKKPGADRIFLTVGLDIYVENGVLVLDTSQFRLHGAGGTGMADYHPIDWYRQDGLVEVRGETLSIVDVASVAATFEVPRTEVERLTLAVGALDIGTVPAIVSRIGRQE